jgi:large subunit ribosomal protein L2
MRLCAFRCTNPGSRNTILSSFKEVGYTKTQKRLLIINHRIAGRNHRGVITCRHRGGGHKRLSRKVDYFRTKLNWIGVVVAIKYDPNRTAYLSLIRYETGIYTYILGPTDLQIGQVVTAGFHVPIKIGNALPLWKIPLGTTVHNVEFRPGAGGQLARSAGNRVRVIAREKNLVTLRLPSGEIRRIKQRCWATIGQVSNVEVINIQIGKAGRVRWLGWRPRIRGSAINPVDHPHGGGEGRCPIGRSCPLTPWGNNRLGLKTRRKKYSDGLVLRR